MTRPMFMSAEHISIMNRLLASDAATMAACATLGHGYVMAYELDDNGTTVWWTMSFEPGIGVRFDLAAPRRPADILFRGDYRSVLDATRRIRTGEAVPLPLCMSGDPKALEAIGPAFAAARMTATVETDFP